MRYWRHPLCLVRAADHPADHMGEYPKRRALEGGSTTVPEALSGAAMATGWLDRALRASDNRAGVARGSGFPGAGRRAPFVEPNRARQSLYSDIQAIEIKTVRDRLAVNGVSDL